MIIISLTDLEALRVSEILKGICDGIEANALSENRPVSAIEELRICAMAEIFKQTSEQTEGRHKEIVKKQKEYNQEYQDDLDRSAELN